MTDKSVRGRRRVPVSCLVCNKRKVKCDKQRPACGRCESLGVPHLCEYAEPHWGAKPSEDEVKYKQLHDQNEKIQAQTKEIDDLKRQLSEMKSKLSSRPITVLNKLCPVKEGLVIHSDNTETNYKTHTDPDRKEYLHYINTYGWINLIKLDPHLTTLWFKITSLQKMYHTYKINQLEKPRPVAGARCSVVECDLSFMNDDGRTPTPLPESEKPRELAPALRALWESTLFCTGPMFTATQVSFLVDYFFASPEHSGLYDLVAPYKRDVDAFVRDGHGAPMCSRKRRKLSASLTHGTLICLASLIVDEALAELSERKNDDYAIRFRTIFPGLHVDHDSRHFQLHETLEMVYRTEGNSLPHMAAVLFLLNRQLAVGSTRISPTLRHLLGAVLEGDAGLWTNPELVSTEREEIRLHITVLWHEVVRITNIVAFGLVPFKHPESLDGLVRKVFEKIDGAGDHHLVYMMKHKDAHLLSLHIHYLVSRVLMVVHHGIWVLGDPKVPVSLLEELMAQCQAWLVDPGLQKLHPVARFEAGAMLHYLKVFLKYVVLLQVEDTNEIDLLKSVCPTILVEVYHLASFLRHSPGKENQYITLAVSEFMKRLIQIVIALLVRARSYNGPEHLRGIFASEIHTNKPVVDICLSQELGVDLDQFLHTHLGNVVGDTINELIDVSRPHSEYAMKLKKVWKFYLTVISSSAKMNYAQIHERVLDMKCPVGKDKPFMSSCPIKSENPIDKPFMSSCPVAKAEPNASPAIIPMARSCPMLDVSNIESRPAPKRKCPFDPVKRELPMGKGIESNVRDQRKNERSVDRRGDVGVKEEPLELGMVLDDDLDLLDFDLEFLGDEVFDDMLGMNKN